MNDNDQGNTTYTRMVLRRNEVLNECREMMRRFRVFERTPRAAHHANHRHDHHAGYDADPFLRSTTTMHDTHGFGKIKRSGMPLKGGDGEKSHNALRSLYSGHNLRARDDSHAESFVTNRPVGGTLSGA
jgi:hypothetical protein